jgi:hypothetical protein
MREIISIIAIFIWATSAIFAQDDYTLVSTSLGEGSGRFEIIQVPQDRRTTFRLDKFSGQIYRLGDCPKIGVIGSQKCWKEMIVVDLPAGMAARPRYQIVMNGVLKMIMLIQAETGQTWQYGIEPTEKWFPFVECTDPGHPNCLWRP